LRKNGNTPIPCHTVKLGSGNCAGDVANALVLVGAKNTGGGSVMIISDCFSCVAWDKLSAAIYRISVSAESGSH